MSITCTTKEDVRILLLATGRLYQAGDVEDGSVLREAAKKVIDAYGGPTLPGPDQIKQWVDDGLTEEEIGVKLSESAAEFDSHIVSSPAPEPPDPQFVQRHYPVNLRDVCSSLGIPVGENDTIRLGHEMGRVNPESAEITVRSKDTDPESKTDACRIHLDQGDGVSTMSALRRAIYSGSLYRTFTEVARLNPDHSVWIGVQNLVLDEDAAPDPVDGGANPE